VNISVIPIDFQVIEEGLHIFIEAKLNGIKANLLIDTGASMSIFDITRLEKYMKTDDLVKNQGTSIGVGTNELVSLIVPECTLHLGDIILDDIQILAVDLSHVNDSYRQIGVPELDGVLGGNILGQLRADISYRRRELRLRLLKAKGSAF